MARFYPDFVAAYLEHTRVREAPEIAHLWAAFWTVAGALRRNVWYDAGGFDWTPNIYAVLTGPPGVIQKSTTAGVGHRLLAHVPGVVFGPDSATWHGMIQRFNSAEATVDTARGPAKISPMSMSVSELGSFLKLTQEGLDSFLIEMFDGQVRAHRWEHLTQTHGSVGVWNGALNLIGCTTLGWLRENVPASALETGVISRIMFVYADQKRELISVPKLDPRWSTKASRDREAKLIDDLIDIGRLRGPFELAPDAYEWQDQWYRRFGDARSEALVSERFDVYRSRRQTYAFKIAMILAAARNHHPTIRVEDIRDAVAHLERLDSGVARIFETIGGPAEAQHVREVVAAVRRASAEGPVTFGHLLRLLGGVMSHDEVALAIRAAVTQGTLRSASTEERDHTGKLLPGLILAKPRKPKEEDS